MKGIASTLWISITLCLLITSMVFGQNEIHVDKNHSNADDSNIGTITEPLLTIKKAVDSAQPGDVIIVGAGRYDERIFFRNSGTSSQYITIKGKNIPDISFPDNSNAQLNNSSEVTSIWGFDLYGSYIKIENLEITNIDRFRSGIFLHDCENIILENNYIHELECSANNWGGIRGNGNNVEVINNILWRVEGSALMIDGENWLIENNDISHGSNQRFSDGLYIGGAADAIRMHGNNHIIANNYIHDFLKSETNGNVSMAAFRSYTYSYPNDYLFDITIESNRIKNIADHAVIINDNQETDSIDPIHNITFANNIINQIGGMAVLLSDVKDFLFINNTVANSESGVVLRQGGTRGACDNAVVVNNIFYNNNTFSTYSESDEENSIWDYNLHYPEIVNPRIVSGYEEHSTFDVNPMFQNYEMNDFNLNEYSAAVDAGMDASAYIEAKDYNNNIRPSGNGWDVGAIESPYTWIPNSAPKVTLTDIAPRVPTENESVNINVEVIDYENNYSKVMIDWGDGTITDWSELVSSNSILNYSHTYSAEGKYEIKLKAIDERMWETEWKAGYQLIVFNGGNETNLRVEPSLNVEVGEEVFFDMTDYGEEQGFFVTLDDVKNIEVTWDFGDGYFMKPGFPYYYNYSTGMNCTHFFMKPGSYMVKMKMTNLGSVDSAIAIINVSGEAPIEGFELWRANFNARIAQYIYAQIPESVTEDPSNKLVVTITGDNGYSETLVSKSGLEKEEKFLLRNAELPEGFYVLQAELLSSNDQRISILREKFDKPYNGAPKVGFNEDNSMFVDGEPFFSVSPWLLNTDRLEEWGNRYINTTRAIGWYPENTKGAWQDYLNRSAENGMYAIGPERFESKGWNFGEDRWFNYRNTDIRKIEEYVVEFKDDPATLAWLWQDELNLGGPSDEVPVQVNAAWAYQTHKLDPQHPHWSQYYGLDYALYANSARNDMYNYLYNEEHFGGKKHFTSEMISHDIYPYDGMTHPGMVYEGRGPLDHWVAALEQLKWRNYNLVPTHQSIETQDIYLNDGPPITDRQLRMITWLGVAHDAKGVNWFQYFQETPPENYNVMGEFFEQITELTPVVFGPEPDIKITSNANTPGNRVDFMVKETPEDIYVFAVRLTEPDEMSHIVSEPENINVQFSINGASSNLKNVVDYFYENERVTETKEVTTIGKQFQLFTEEGSITPGTVLLAGWRENIRHNWLRVYDDSEGNLYGNIFGAESIGTVNYETGEINITFAFDIVVGKKSIKVCYQPVRTKRILQINGGVFSDTFAKEDVHIYKISKTGAQADLVSLNLESLNGKIQRTPKLEQYEKGAIVTLTAQPDSGFQFVSWSGDIDSVQNPVTLTIDSTMNIIALFEEVIYSNALVDINFDNNINNNADNDLEPFWHNGEGTFTNGFNDKAILLDGTSDGTYLRIKRNELLENFNDVTISAHVKKNSASSGGTIFVKHVCYRLNISGDDVTGYIFANGNRVNIGGNNIELINNTDWHNYALKYDGTEVSLYIDDQLIDSKQASGNLFNSSTIWHDLIIGKHPWGNNFDGAIDNFNITVPVMFAKNNSGELESDIPTEYNLSQNYPNPFNPTTTIQYSIPNSSLVKISVYNLLGEEVALLVNEFKNAGKYSVGFNASRLTSGMYLYRITAGSYTSVKKMLLIK